jgi:hypothetical protein
LTKGSNSLTKYINVLWIIRYANKYFWSLISKLVCQTTPFIKSQCVNNPNKVSRWTNEQDHLSKKKSLKIFCAMSWNILGIHFFHMANFKVTWQNIPRHVIKYFATSPKYFLESTKFYWLWTGAWQIELSNVTSCEGLKIKENKNNPRCN